MRRYEYDPQTANGWKSYPIQVIGPEESRCCNQPTLLVQSMQGGFVTSNCSKCGKSDTLPERDFLDLHMWVNCPECRKKMHPEMVDKNYTYQCDKCQLYIWLSDLLPNWEELV